MFLFVADVTEGDIYCAAVERTIRRDYAKLSSQETMTFPLIRGFSLSEKFGPPGVEFLARRERLHRDFVHHISGLISHAEGFHEFIGMNQGRDSFMEVEAEAHLRFRALYQSCRMAADYLGIEWSIESLRDLYTADRAQFQDEWVLLHEFTLDRALVQIEAIFPKLLRAAVDLIAMVEGAYWRAHDPILYSLCSSNALEWSIKRMEEDLARGER